MATNKFLDLTGAAYLWGKVKSYVTTAVSGKQETLVSGTNIKTINSTSLLGSGDIEISSGSSAVTAQVTLASADWINSTQTVSVTGVAASNNTVVIFPATASAEAMNKCGVVCTTLGSGSLTFSCTATPESNLTVDIMIFSGSSAAIINTTSGLPIYGVATTSSNGLMASTDKTKLNALPGAVTSGTTDYTSGTTPLTTGEIYLVYE